ncbi:MAG: AbrB/MazE/SpoVT family DNA-binding domain-containing protein [Nitrospirota bacterium]
MLAKKTSKNQLTLPKDVVNAFPETEYFDVTVKDQKIVLTPVRITPVNATLEGVRNKMKKLGISPNDVSEAIQWARKRK